MILYHGTTAEKGKQIIEDMYIKAYIKRNYIDYNDVIKNTTNGFVYLTVNLPTAYYYANINLIGAGKDENKYAYIFKLSVDENMLLPDYDEIRVKCKDIQQEQLSYMESIRLCGCVTVSKNVEISDAEYIILPGTSNFSAADDESALCKRLTDWQINGGNVTNTIQEIEKKFPWMKI